MSNVSLDETLFYQYMINNNSTSTMLNALSGRNSEDSTYGNMAGVLSALQSSSSWGTGSISDVSTLLGLGGLGSDYGSIGSLGSFSSILQTYMNQNQVGAASMVEKLEDVLEKTAETEGDTLSYQTVEEIYKYFTEMTAGKAQQVQSGESSAQSSAATPSMAETLGTNFDFDSFETETDDMIEAALEEIGA